MKFKHIPTGQIFSPVQVRKKFTLTKVGERNVTTIFPKNPNRWDEMILKRFELERVND